MRLESCSLNQEQGAVVQLCSYPDMSSFFVFFVTVIAVIVTGQFLDVSFRFQDQLRVMGPAGFVVWRSTYFSSLQLDSAWHTWHVAHVDNAFVPTCPNSLCPEMSSTVKVCLLMFIGF